MAEGKVSLPLDDFLIMWANNSGRKGTSPATMRKYLDGFQKTILEQMELNGSVYIHNFGTFKVNQREGRSAILNDIKTGEMQRRWCKARLYSSWIPSAVFERAINENEFKLVKPVRKKRRYTASEYREIRNDRRRKEKKPVQVGILDMFNEMDRKSKESENGET